MNLDTLSEYADRYAEKKYGYLRWLMVLAIGSFSLMAGLTLGKPYLGCQLLALKAALSANAVGILFGAIAVSGEVRRANEGLRLASLHTINNQLPSYERETNVTSVSSSPRWQDWVDRAFYYSLLASLSLWVAFVWL